MVKKLTFPSFWSRYASAPQFLAESRGTTPEDRVKVADVVLLLRTNVVKKPRPAVGYGFFGAAPASTLDALVDVEEFDPEVRVLKNTTWDRTVGKTFRVSKDEIQALAAHVEDAPEQARKDWGLLEMVCLIRTP